LLRAAGGFYECMITMVFLVRIVAIVLLLAPLYFSCFVHALSGTPLISFWAVGVYKNSEFFFFLIAIDGEKPLQCANLSMRCRPDKKLTVLNMK